jgi:hypothetical protein
MNVISAILFLLFIVFPAIAIFAFTSRLFSGIYHWADRQHYAPEPINVQINTIKTVETFETRQAPTSLESYLGHKPEWEDSEEYRAWLDKQAYDVRQHL